MGKIKKLKLTPMQHQALENEYRNGSLHASRMRCKAVMLKAQGLNSPKVGEQLEMHQVSVNNRVKRFVAESLNGLEARPGQGSKPVIGTFYAAN